MFPVLSAYLSFKSVVQTASDHAPSIGLDGDDGPETMSECPAHHAAPTASLEQGHPLPGHMVRLIELPGAVQGLES